MMLEPGDMVFNKIEHGVQLVIEVEPAREFAIIDTDNALTMAHDGEMLWYPVTFLAEPPKKAGDDEAW